MLLFFIIGFIVLVSSICFVASFKVYGNELHEKEFEATEYTELFKWMAVGSWIMWILVIVLLGRNGNKDNEESLNPTFR